MYYRYVDDIFSYFVSKASSLKFFDKLNRLHPALRFTLEEEENNSLPFLDVRVTRSVSGITTSLYRKPTFTGLYTPWDSFSPTLYKINTIRALTHRIIRICSPSVIEDEFNTLRSILSKNGYPGHLLDKLITLDQRQRRFGPKLCPLVIRLPWLGRVTERLIRKANDAVRLAYFAGEVRAVFNTNRAFSLPKERLPTHSLSNVIYLFECRQCESRYVGRTSQRLAERIKQHVPQHLVDSVQDPNKKRRGRPPKLSDGFQSAIACHLAANRDCCLSYRESNFKVLSRCRSKHLLNVLEAMYIYLLKPVLCKQKSFVTSLTLFKHSHSAQTMHSHE